MILCMRHSNDLGDTPVINFECDTCTEDFDNEDL